LKLSFWEKLREVPSWRKMGSTRGNVSRRRRLGRRTGVFYSKTKIMWGCSHKNRSLPEKGAWILEIVNGAEHSKRHSKKAGRYIQGREVSVPKRLRGTNGEKRENLCEKYNVTSGPAPQKDGKVPPRVRGSEERAEGSKERNQTSLKNHTHIAEKDEGTKSQYKVKEHLAMSHPRVTGETPAFNGMPGGKEKKEKREA